jgi:hypothetical protein
LKLDEGSYRGLLDAGIMAKQRKLYNASALVKELSGE